jgi:adenosylcobinamide-GDP ribazoletransferase
MRRFKTAFKFLTLAEDADDFYLGPAGVAVLCWPLAGLALGFLLVLVNRAAEPYVPTEILAVLLFTVLVLATGGHHLAGMQKTLNILANKNALANSSDGWPIYGLVAVLLVVLFKTHAIAAIGESRALSLILAPLLARWSFMLLLFGTAPADISGARITGAVRSWHLIAASVASLGFALYFAGARALWVALPLSLIALGARSYLCRRQGGVSLANCGALIEVSEALGFTLFASL